MFQQLKPAFMMLAVMTLLTGVAYPLLVTGVAQTVFPFQANGSLIERDGQPVASALIGQNFDAPRYFWSRPSATTPTPYNAAGSGGSNLAATNPDLLHAVQARLGLLRAADPANSAPVPIDLVTTSASGLDPHISPAAAEYQVLRVARARRLAPEAVRELVVRHTEHRTFGLLGEPRVHVVQLNMDLDRLAR